MSSFLEKLKKSDFNIKKFLEGFNEVNSVFEEAHKPDFDFKKFLKNHNYPLVVQT